MSSKAKKILLLILAAVLLVGVSRVQIALNADRERLGLTRTEPLENAPPVLAFTTVALGGFRGLIANVLWIRSNDLQDKDKFFEAMQLADWITKLEPHFPQVWAYLAWNMAYNISVKFKDAADRWRWVRAGFELLRDQGLRYNPHNVLIYRELGWIFQHKMGQNLDDAHMYYKQQWLKDMSRVFGKKKPNLDELIHPKTEDERRRREILIKEFKMDPKFMKEVDERYGPLEWRLPEASAIYWAALGLKMAKENPTKVKADDLIQLRRVIFQSMQQSFHQGRLIENPFEKVFEFGPNLDLIPKVNATYEQMYAEETNPAQKKGILHAQRNFLRDAVYFLYEADRRAEAQQWFNYLGKKFPDQRLVDGDPNSLPRNMTLDDYATGRVVEDVGEMSQYRVKAAIEGMVLKEFHYLALGEDRYAAGARLLARRIRAAYMKKIAGSEERLYLPPVDEVEKETLKRILNPKDGWPFEVRAVLRGKLGMPPESAPSPASTNAPPTATTTNAPAAKP